jgi:MFS family permease
MFRALRHRNYALFFVGQGLSLIGTWVQQTAEVWLAYRLTRSPTMLGVVGFASQTPIFLFAPLAGAIIDRVNRHRLVTMAQALSMLQAFILAALVIGHRITITQLIILSLFSGFIDAVEVPSRQSFVIDMIGDPQDLSNAIALNSSLVNVARLVGPAVAGLLIAAVGEGWCFFINGVSYLTVIAALLMMKVPRREMSKTSRPLIQTLREGIFYIRNSRPIATLLGLLALVSLMASTYSVLIPIFASQMLHGGAHTLGFLMTASGAGALTAALYMATRRTVRGLGRVILFGISLFSLGLIAFSWSHLFWVSWICMYGIGLGMMSGTASMNTMLQTIVDDDKRGRVMSFFTMAFIGMAPIGNLVGGRLAQSYGAPLTVRTAGVVAAIGAMVFAWDLPRLRDSIRPIYQRLGIIPEVAASLQTAMTGPRRSAG